MKSILIGAGICVTALSAAAQESFSISRAAITCGGGGSSGPGEFTIRGAAVGQFVGRDTDNGPPGEFDITGGYWTFELEPPLILDLNLTISLDGGAVKLTWDDTAPPVVLESSADLQLWAPVVPQPAEPFFQEPLAGQRYYRLRRP